ncbi:MAG: hypothetical protein ACHQX4_02970 [Gemmatimonadales bacterium]
MGTQALLQSALGLFGIWAFFRAITFSWALSETAGMPSVVGGRSVTLVLIMLQMLVLFAVSFAFILDNRRVARAFMTRWGIEDAPVPGADLRTVAIGLFGASLLLRALPALIDVVGTFVRSRQGAPQMFAVALVELGAGLFLLLRPSAVLELWEPGGGQRAA